MDAKNKKIAFLSGNEALGRGAYEAGLSSAAAYPGTPSTEILQYLAQYDEIDSQWSINEKVAYEVAYASALAGKRSLFAAKHVGINVAMDGLMTSAYIGVNGAFVVVTSDDPGLHSSQNEQDNRRIAPFAKIPLLEPSSPSEAKEFVKYAFRLSEENDIPVLLRLTTRISHTKETMELDERIPVAVKPYVIDPMKTVMAPRMAYLRHIDLEKRLLALKQISESCPLNREEMGETSIGFLTSSISYLYVKEMYPNASVLKLGMTYPFPEEAVKSFAEKVDTLVVVEELEPILEDELRKLGIACIAKDPSFRIGELRPEFIPRIVAGEKKIEPEVKTRTPQLCTGCPHSYVFDILKDMDVVVTGDIGCYTLGALPPFKRIHTCLCMGASIPFMESFSKVLDKKVVGVIGDSTFFHTGIAGLVNAVYNGAKGVVLILDNSTTAMTGSQPHPGTGWTIKGKRTKTVSMQDVCTASGVDSVDLINPSKVEELRALIEKRLSEDSLAVIIIKSACKLIRSPLKTVEAYRYQSELTETDSIGE
jgi:indolepyruvate ferredoxin oxidoreductase, alpha subunit